MDVNNAVSVLEELVQTCKDGQKGYQEAAAKVKRPDLKTFFNEQAQERGRFAEELELEDRKSTRLNSSHYSRSRMPSSA